MEIECDDQFVLCATNDQEEEQKVGFVAMKDQKDPFNVISPGSSKNFQDNRLSSLSVGFNDLAVQDPITLPIPGFSRAVEVFKKPTKAPKGEDLVESSNDSPSEVKLINDPLNDSGLTRASVGYFSS